ncbi:MAG: hypothetical protein ACD_30C00045G0003 [uncultured bacterium]|nr:MAG: hypothetical protein ACD_30C00045G0003 [uncultured bacterium]
MNKFFLSEIKNSLKIGNLKFKITQQGFIKLTKKTLATYLIVSTVALSSGLIYLFSPTWFGSKVEAAWVDDDWGFRQEVPVTSTNGSAQSNVFISFSLDTATLITAGKLQSSCQDIRITTQAGEVLPYHVGRTNACNNAATTIDFLLTSFPDLKSTYYVYYGNPSAVSADAGAFSQSQASNYSVGTLGTEAKGPTPTLYWKMDEGQGSTLNNSGNASGSGAIPAFVQQGGNNGGDGSGANLTATVGTTTAGNSFIAAVTWDDSATTTVTMADSNSNSGWTAVTTKQVDVRHNQAMQIFYLPNIVTAGASHTVTATFSPSAAYRRLIVHEVSGLDTSGSVDQTAVVNNEAGTAVSVGPVTPTVNNEYIFATVVDDSGSQGWTAVLPFTERGYQPPADTTDMQTQDYVQTTAASISPSWTLSGTEDAMAQTATFKPATSPTGALNNTPTWQTEDMCVAGKCLYFDGANNENVSTPDNGALDFAASDNFTVSAWVKRDGASSAINYIITKASGATYTGYKLSMDASGDLCFAIRDGTNAEDSACTSAVDFDNDVWHFVSGVKAGTSSITLYVDGQQRAQDASIAATGTLANTGTFYAGVDLDGTSNEWLGYIDEVKVYRDNTARTAAQVKADFNAKSSKEGASGVLGTNTQNQPNALSNGLVGYWKMDESSGNAADSSGNSLTLTNNATATYTAGKFGNAGTFVAASSQYFSTATTISGVKTVSFWTNNASTTDEYINLIASTAYITSSSGTVSATGFTSPTIYVNGVINGTLTASVWNHVVVTTDTGINANAFEVGRGNGAYNNGKIDDTRVYNRALSASDVSQLYNFAPGPVGYWKLDESSWTVDCSTTSVADSSGNGFNGTACPTSTGPAGGGIGKYGKAGYFDGSDDYVNIADPSSGALDTTGGVSISAWVKPTNFSAIRGVVSKGATSCGTNCPYDVYIDTSGRVNFVRSSASTFYWTRTTSGITANTWTYITVSDDVATSTIRFYINGVAAAAGVVSGSYLTSTANASDVRIGIRADSATKMLGYIDDLRIYNYFRTPEQVFEDMNASHPAPGSPIGSAVGYWRFDEGYSTTANDSAEAASGSDNLTLNSASWTTAGKFGKAWNGTGSTWLSKSDDDEFDLGTADSATFTGWFKTDSANNPAAIEYLIAKGPTSAAGYAVYANTDGTICFGIDDDATWNPDVSSCTTTDYYDGTWHHFSAVRDVISDKIYIYIDALLKDSDTDSTSATLNNSSSFIVGDLTGSDDGNEFNGDLDEIKYYRSPLDVSQVALDYNRGQSQVLGAAGDNSGSAIRSQSQEYCVPGSSDTCTAPVGRWDLNEKSGSTTYDTTGNGFNGTITGAAWVPGKVGGALDFDGTDDIVTISDNATLRLTSAFTLSFWMKADVAPSTSRDTPVSKYQNYTFNWGEPDSNLQQACVYKDATDNDQVSKLSSTLSANTWYFITCVYDGINLKAYLNGNLEASNARNAPKSGTAFDLLIGDKGADSSYFPGLVDQVRIFNYARTASQVAYDYNQGEPVAHWRMDECQGTTTNDSSGNSNTGTLTVGATGTQTSAGSCTTSSTAWGNGATGKRNYSLNFDGTDDYVQVTDTANLRFDASTADFSLFAWVKRTTTGTEYIISKEDADDDGWRMQFNSSNQVLCSEDATDVTSTQTITDTSWYLVGCTIDRDGNGQVYIDGKSTGSAVSMGTDAMATTSNIRIATRSYTSTSYLNGQIDDVKIFNYSLTAKQVQQLYNGGTTRTGPVTGSP